MTESEFRLLKPGDTIRLISDSHTYASHFPKDVDLSVVSVFANSYDFEVFVQAKANHHCDRVTDNRRPPNSCGPWMGYDRFQKVVIKFTDEELKNAGTLPDPDDLGKLLGL